MWIPTTQLLSSSRLESTLLIQQMVTFDHFLPNQHKKTRDSKVTGFDKVSCQKY